MKILPARTHPATDPIERRHGPAGSYTRFRACLRWEFGFTCSFCLIHEADLAEHGVEGTGLTWIEHHIPRSHDVGHADDYANCFYSCRFCNSARATAPNVDDSGRRLLEPCGSAWAASFELCGDELRPNAGDNDAAYTHETYDLDEPRKQIVRRDRARSIELAREVLHDGPPRIQRLLRVAEGVLREDRGVILEAAESLHTQVWAARNELLRFRVVPPDADVSCGCPVGEHLAIPRFLDGQCQERSDLD